MGSFNSLSLSRKMRTSLAAPYNRLTQSTSWFFVWQLSRAGSSSVRNLPCCASQQVYQISGDEITTMLYLRQQERWDENLKSQRASAAWEQESSLQHPAEVSALWNCASALTQPPTLPIRLWEPHWFWLLEGHTEPPMAFTVPTPSVHASSLLRNNSLSSLAEMGEMHYINHTPLSSQMQSLHLITSSCKNGLPSNMPNKRLSLQKPSSLLLSSAFFWTYLSK